MCSLSPLEASFTHLDPPATSGHSEKPRMPYLGKVQNLEEVLSVLPGSTRIPSSADTQLSQARQSLRNILASANLWNSPFCERKDDVMA